MNNSSVDINNKSLDEIVNVSIKVVNKKGKIVQQLSKHNKATRNMTEGIIRFLRGEFNTTFLREFRDTLNNIGDNSMIARQYIPTHIGIGNIGINISSGEINAGTTKFAKQYEPSYSDTGLLQEILPKYNLHRAKIQKSTKSESIMSDTYGLSVQGYYQFNQKVNEYTSLINRTEDNALLEDESPFNFVYANSLKYESPVEVTQFTNEEGLHCITVTELGLFSGDFGDNGSQLLARLLLDPSTPLIITEDDTVIIRWTIGVQSLNEMLFNSNSSSNYKYQNSAIDN